MASKSLSSNSSTHISNLFLYNWNELNTDQQHLWDNFIINHYNLLQQLTYQYKLKSNQQLFEFLQKNPDKLTKILFPDQDSDQAVVNAALLKQLVDEMHQDQTELNNQLKSHLPNLPDNQLDQIIQILLHQQAIKFQKQITNEQLKQTQQQIETLHPKTENKTDDPLYIAKQTVKDIINRTADKTFTPVQKQQAEAYLLTAITSGTCNPANLRQLTLATETSLILANPNYNKHPATTHVIKEITSIPQPTTSKIYTVTSPASPSISLIPPSPVTTKIYDDPNNDPIIQRYQKKIIQITNLDVKRIQEGLWGEAATKEAKTNYGDTWTKNYKRIRRQLWEEFTLRYPKKAGAYKNKFGPIKKALETQKSTSPVTRSMSPAPISSTVIILPFTNDSINIKKLQEKIAAFNSQQSQQELLLTQQKITNNNFDLSETTLIIQAQIKRIKEQLENSPQIHQITQQIIGKPFNYNQLFKLQPSKFSLIPTPVAAKTAEIIKPANPHLAAGIEAYSQGLTINQFTQLIQKYIQQRQADNNPLSQAEIKQIHQARQILIQIENSSLAQEIKIISPSNRPTSSSQRLNSIRTSINQFIHQLPPGPIKNIATFITSPIRSIKTWLARKAGKKLAKKIYKTLGKHITGKLAKKITQAFLEKGVQKAIKFLLKQSIKKGAQAIAQLANIAPGLGVLLGILIEIGDKILTYIIKPIIAVTIGLIVSIWGSKPKPEEIITPFIFAGQSAMLAGQLGIIALLNIIKAARAAVTAAVTTIIISTAAVFFLYLTAITIGPIIAGLAQIGPFEPGTIGLVPGTYTPDPDDTFENTTTNISCFVFNNSLYPWPDQYKEPIITALKQLKSAPANYFNQICSNGDIQIQFAGHNGKVGGQVLSSNLMVIYSASNFSPLYTIAHESGHIFARQNPSIKQKFYFDTNVLSEGYLDSYTNPSSSSKSEDFAETIAVYIAKSYVLNRYPYHRQFANKYIF